MPTPQPLDAHSLETLVHGYRRNVDRLTIDELETPFIAGDVAVLLATINQQQQRIAAVRLLHRARQCGCSDPECTAHTLADCCYGEEWPCPTARALDITGDAS